ncbi:MAG: hypothetical protein WBD09_06400 [Halobacteriota archaeon]
MPIEEPFKDTRKKIKEIEEKYKAYEFTRELYELENIRKAEVTILLNELNIDDTGFMYLTDEAKKDAQLIGISSKEGEEETGKKTMYSTVKDVGKIMGELKHELSCTEECWCSSIARKESKNNKGRKNDE